MTDDTSSYYDAYWEKQRENCRAERRRLRTLQRAGLVLQMVSCREGKLLEIGCGPGDAAAFFSRNGFEVFCVEVSPKAASDARKKGLNVLCCDIEKEEPPCGPFDVIVALEVLEHLHNPLDVIPKLFNCLRKDGELIISLPNEFHLFNRLSVAFGGEPFGGHDDPHIRHFGMRSIKRFVRSADTRIDLLRAASVLPPRFKLLRPLGNLLCRIRPKLFAISVIVSLKECK